MSEDFVSRDEFNSLKQEVQELKVEVNEYKQLLTQIDKKCDVITERISNGDKIDELKLQPLTTRIENLEKLDSASDSQSEKMTKMQADLTLLIAEVNKNRVYEETLEKAIINS